MGQLTSIGRTSPLTADDHRSGTGLWGTDMPDAHISGTQALPYCQTKTYDARMRSRELVTPQNCRRAGVHTAL